MFACATANSLLMKVLIPNLEFSLFYSHAWKYNIQANESLTKVKEK